METTLATLGAIALLAAIVGGGFSAAGATVPVINSLGRQFLLGTAGLGLLFVAFTLSEGFSNGPGSDPVSSVTTSSDALNGRTPAPTNPGTTDSPQDSTGCVIEVTHFAADIKAEPDHSSQTLSGVPEGTYTPIDSTVADWAGRPEQWFQIEVEGRVGWIVDEPILLSKSADCP